MNDIFYNLEENYKKIKENILEAQLKSGIKRDKIVLLAATKNIPANVINHAISLGINNIGENNSQELISKYELINKEKVNINMIGHLQTNKVKKIINKVSMIQSVDSIKLANEISKFSKNNNITSNILIEINIGKEPNKSGILKENLDELLINVSKLSNIKIKGLMVIPPFCKEIPKSRSYFSDVYKIFIDIKGKKLDNVEIDILSMGMSNDYVEAILQGSTMVRIGSSLFAPRI